MNKGMGSSLYCRPWKGTSKHFRVTRLGLESARAPVHTKWEGRPGSGSSLLDTYHAERHPVAARVLQSTMPMTALMRPADARLEALRGTVSELLSMDEPRKRFAGMLSGLDIHYDLGEGHPLLGRRMPDIDLDTSDGQVRVFSLLHEARPHAAQPR